MPEQSYVAPETNLVVSDNQSVLVTIVTSCLNGFCARNLKLFGLPIRMNSREGAVQSLGIINDL